VNGPKPRLRIQVDLAQAGEGLAAELADLLAAHPGGNPVVLELTRPGEFVANLRVGRPRAVEANEEVIDQVRALSGVFAAGLEKQGGV